MPGVAGCVRELNEQGITKGEEQDSDLTGRNRGFP
jgi:hypothetical protein